MKNLRIIFDRQDVPPSLNGAHGLLRMHYRKKAVLKNKNAIVIKMQNPERIIFKGKVHVKTHGYAVRLSDWDNFASRFKSVADALVACGVIEDDNPKIITKFEMDQTRVYKMDQIRYEVEIIGADE